MKGTVDNVYELVKAAPRGSSETTHGRGSSAEGLSKTEAQEKVKLLLKIDILNKHAETLLESKEFHAFIKEKLGRKVRGVAKSSFAASFNRHFFSIIFSNRLIAYLYWGADNR